MLATIGNPTAHVNGYLTGSGRRGVPARSRPMLQDVVTRVERRLAQTGLSASAASRAAGLSADAIRNLQRAAKEGSRQGVSTRTINALAPVLQTNVNWLLNGGDDDEPATDSVQVVGYVSAGAALVQYGAGQGPFDQVEAPRKTTLTMVAAHVRGTSLGPAFDHSIVFYDDVRSPVTENLIGKLCVVGLDDDRVLVKILRDAGDGLFHLLSNTVEEPLLNQRVVWAAKVTEVRPR